MRLNEKYAGAANHGCIRSFGRSDEDRDRALEAHDIRAFLLGRTVLFGDEPLEGVTKGTLLYHFHDKNQLLEALMQGYVAQLQARLDVGIEWVRAKGYNNLARERETIAGFIEWYRDFRRQALSYTSFGVSILSISAEDERLRKPALDWYRELFAKLRLSGDTRVVEAALTIEGLFFLRHFRLDTTTDEEVEAILSRMEKTLLE